jgi:hypothetical protein
MKVVVTVWWCFHVLHNGLEVAVKLLLRVFFLLHLTVLG